MNRQGYTTEKKVHSIIFYYKPEREKLYLSFTYFKRMNKGEYIISQTFR